MFRTVEHIGIAVKDLEKAILFYQEVMGLELNGIEEIEKDKVKIAFMDAKNVKIELISAISQDSGVAKFLESRGEGIHHISYEVDNIKEFLKHLETTGIELVDKEPRIGAHNKLIAFLHPKDTYGVLIELCESPK